MPLSAPTAPLTPPAAVRAELAGLSDALDVDVPAKRLEQNLLVATWNLRAFGGLTDGWTSPPGASPRRNEADVRAIAEVVSRFDVVALQEVRGDLRALRHALKALGPAWGLILTDVNRGPRGNGERLAYVFDTRRVTPSGLACELVVPDEWLRSGRIGAGALREQFARTPYAVSFRSGGQTFILVTLHVLFGEGSADRVGELRGIADWLAEWAAQADEYGQNLIALGDFNIDRRDDPAFEAFTARGLRPPPELDGLSRTIFDRPGAEHFYDQIAWFHEGGRARLQLEYTGGAGRFEWTRHLLRGVDDVERSWRISDHYPLWVEFGVRPLGGARSARRVRFAERERPPG